MEPLPFNAKLEQYHQQSAELLRGHADGNAGLLQLIHQNHPRFLDREVRWLPLAVSDDEIRAAPFDTGDARLALARWYSFRDWAALTDLVNAIEAQTPGIYEFELAAEAVITGDREGLEIMLRSRPDLVRARSSRVTCHDPAVHRATLLHYVAANGVEGYRQRTPKNAVTVARLLLEGGADPDALADMYGEQCTPMSMLASSSPPAEAGVQVALIETLLDYGANPDGQGTGKWVSPVMTALVFGFVDAALTLARRGAARGLTVSPSQRDSVDWPKPRPCYQRPTPLSVIARWRWQRKLVMRKLCGCCWKRAKILTATIPMVCTPTPRRCITRPWQGIRPWCASWWSAERGWTSPTNFGKVLPPAGPCMQVGSSWRNICAAIRVVHKVLMLKQFLPFVIISSALMLISCWGRVAPTGPEQRESRSIDLDNSERVRVELKMPVGELDVGGGAQKLLDADFTYNVAAWKPDIRYRSGAPAADLTIQQQGPKLASGNTKNRWDLRFNDNVPLDFRVELDAGEARLNLGSLSLRSVELEMGAGTLRLDLRGVPTKDYSVRVRGGVGEATVYLPRNVGVSATASGGLGDISVTGLRKSGDRYVNDAYEQATVRIRLDIQGGVGSIKLIGE